MTRLATAATAAALLAALAGCAGSAGTTPTASGPAGSPAASSSAPMASSPAAETPASPAEALAGKDAEAVGVWLAEQGVPVQVTRGSDETTEPNDRPGPPGGYTSKAAFADSRIPKSDYTGSEPDSSDRGGSIEVFADEAGAIARAAEVQGKLKDYGLGAEYDYVVGGVLVRVSGNVTPSQAKAYQDALGVPPQPAA